MKRFIAKNKLLCVLAAASVGFVAAGLLWSFVALSSLPGPLALHFNDYVGINQIGGSGYLLAAGIMGFAVLAVNFSIAFVSAKNDPQFAAIVAVATLFLALLLFVGFAAIIGVN